MLTIWAFCCDKFGGIEVETSAQPVLGTDPEAVAVSLDQPVYVIAVDVGFDGIHQDPARDLCVTFLNQVACDRRSSIESGQLPAYGQRVLENVADFERSTGR